MKPETPAETALHRLQALRAPETLAKLAPGDDKTRETCRAQFYNPTPFLRRFPGGLQALAVLGLLLNGAACTPAQTVKLDKATASPPGQLFCTLQTLGGGDLLVRLVQAGTQKLGASPETAAIAIIATNSTKDAVDQSCARAAVAVGADRGTPVSPPASPATAQAVAVTPPSGTQTAPTGL